MTLPSTNSARAEGSLPGKAIVSPEALYQIVDGEAVILHLGNQCYYGLNDIGSRIWELLAEGASPESIVARLISEYDSDEPVVRHDLLALLNRLAEAGLVRIEA